MSKPQKTSLHLATVFINTHAMFKNTSKLHHYTEY